MKKHINFDEYNSNKHNSVWYKDLSDIQKRITDKHTRNELKNKYSVYGKDACDNYTHPDNYLFTVCNCGQVLDILQCDYEKTDYVCDLYYSCTCGKKHIVSH